MRRAQKMRPHDTDPVYITPEGLERMKQDVKRMEHQQPEAIDALRRAIDLGDLSENAEYMESKRRLASLQAKIFYTKERIKHAVLIDAEVNASSGIQLGSTVTVRVRDQERTYQIVGSYEANPSQGRISNTSPIGSALLGAHVGDTVNVETPNGTQHYTIIAIR